MPAKHWSTDTHSVRERFGMGVVLLATVYTAALFALFRAWDAPWTVPVYLAGVAVWVAVCQVLARRLNRPRAVSVVAGVTYVGAWPVLLFITSGYPIGHLGWMAFGSVVSGSLLGYFFGALDASLFLVHDWLRDTLRAKREEREALRAAMGETPRESPWDE